MLLEEAHKLELESNGSSYRNDYRNDYSQETYYVMQEIPQQFSGPSLPYKYSPNPYAN